MSVNYTRPSLLTAAHVMYNDNKAVEALAQLAIVSMVESAIEMIVDCEEEYPTKQDIQSCLNNQQDISLDFVSEAMDELKERVLTYIKTNKAKINITSLKYCDVDGLLTDVDCSVGFEKPAAL